MAQFELDTELFAQSLERGIFATDNFLTELIPTDMRLRMPYCGISSIATKNYFAEFGIQTNLLAHTFQFPFLNQPETHVIAEVLTGSESVYIDATYSQFMSYAGIGLYPELHKYFPAQKVAVFTPDTVESVIIDPMTEAAINFYDVPLENEHMLLTRDLSPFRYQEDEEIRAVYEEIWDLSRYDSFEPSKQTQRASIRLSTFVLQGMQPLA